MMKAILSVALVSALCSSAALAHNAGDLFVRGGAAIVMPTESSDNVLKVDDDTQAAATFTYMTTDNIGVELLLATPFTHDVSLGDNKVAEVSHLPPSLMVQYYFGKPDSKVRPYVGAGVNYTIFFDEKEHGDALGGADVSVDNSLGGTVQAGLDVKLDEHWFANASVWYMDIDTDVHVDNTTIGTEIDPVSVMLGLGYTF
ncbi:outer membrane protein OmpW [Psychromonas sp. MB-3u-54]|uniref:OmpW family outer membrane protein n=1 Tax=Psychromonas sp. MB-3u-54 TaxID=2058319 RepID=UPI000C31FFFB|nr:OmpW family outer membrane protein [Psychromonas sp. MB-3u-54]PKH03555.1 outer membrane protein OmpW [Psychromonas sp. MB-3u-54]